MAHHLHRRPYAIVPLLCAGLLYAHGSRAEADIPGDTGTGTGTESRQAPAELAGGQDRWASCAPAHGFFAEAPPSINGKPGHTALSADKVVSQVGGISRFRGDVVVQRDGRTLQGDEARYDQQSGEITIEGNVAFHAEELVMQGERASMRMEEQSGEFDGVSFFYPRQHAFGSAEQLTRTDPQHSTLKGVRYTTCNPGQEDWLLSARELQLDQQTNTGEAYHTVFRFKNVPIFYSPYLNFPLTGRKSGILPPTFGTSNSNGTDIRLPVYWNIAPNYDATFTPRNLTKRGPMLMSEFRFLTENTSGQIQGDFLSDDKIYGDDRSYLAVDHKSSFARGWGTSLKLRHTSDELYLSDLGEEEGASTTTHLERRFDLNYSDQYWKFMARAQSYQTLTGSEPYQRLPQLTLDGQGTRRPNQLQFSLQSEAVTFAHDTRIPVGTRLDLKPAVTLPLQGSAWFLTPTAAWRYTDYSLDDNPQGDSYTRSLPILSLDSGLFFDRETSIAGRAMTHTLEPRLFYLSVPYEDQDALPLFDTGNSDLSFSQLFHDNRFNGADRQSDAEQLTTALTTRLLDDTSGTERLRASIGRIYYFTDRQVTLYASDPVDTAPHSDLFAELELQPVDRLSIGLDVRYDTELARDEQLNGHIRYRPDAKRQLSLDYRFDEAAQLRQTDALLFWPMARQWQFLGRWRYDLDNEENLDLLGGVEYESCCWSVRLLGRNHRLSSGDDIDHSIYLTFEFKGLASLGARLEDALGGDLLTYE